MQLLRDCAKIKQKELSPEEIKFWTGFLAKYSIAELRYAFDHWNANCRWFPQGPDIGELCEAYRLGEAEKLLPIGCARCEWTGFYQVRRNGVERVVAECPCRVNVSLRVKDNRQPASSQEVADMFKRLKEFGIDKAMDKPVQRTGLIPTTRELAETLAKRGHARLLGQDE